MPDPTTNYGWDLPNNNADDSTWGVKLNTILDALDGLVWGNLPRDGTRSMTGTLTFAPGSTLVPFAKFQSGSLLTTPQAHAVEWNGSDCYFTTSAGTRKQVAYTDSNSTGNAATASKWATARTLTVNGDLSGSVVIDGSENETLSLTLSADAVRLVALPPGAVQAFAMNTAPAGWLECAGQAVSRTTYAALFAAIGTTFGVGDGSTTFNLPNLRGEFVRGWDNGRGIDTGRVFGSAQTEMVGQHTHPIQGKVSSSLRGDSGSLDSFSGSNSNTYNTGNNTGTENRPRNVALLYAIKT